DDTGLDFAPDLRDYLRDHGPCRDVMLVFADDHGNADLVVSGTARAKLNREQLTREVRGGMIWTGIGLGTMIDGLVFSNVGEEPTLHDIGNDMLIAGAVLTALGIGLFIADHSRQSVVVTGKIDADLVIERRDGSVDRWTISDEVVAKRSHPD